MFFFNDNLPEPNSGKRQKWNKVNDKIACHMHENGSKNCLRHLVDQAEKKAPDKGHEGVLAQKSMKRGKENRNKYGGNPWVAVLTEQSVENPAEYEFLHDRTQKA